jgi:hypothetical protein
LIASLAPDYRAKDFSISALTDQARQIFERKIADVGAGKIGSVKGSDAIT